MIIAVGVMVDVEVGNCNCVDVMDGFARFIVGIDGVMVAGRDG